MPDLPWWQWSGIAAVVLYSVSIMRRRAWERREWRAYKLRNGSELLDKLWYEGDTMTLQKAHRVQVRGMQLFAEANMNEKAVRQMFANKRSEARFRASEHRRKRRLEKRHEKKVAKEAARVVEM